VSAAVVTASHVPAHRLERRAVPAALLITLVPDQIALQLVAFDTVVGGEAFHLDLGGLALLTCEGALKASSDQLLLGGHDHRRLI